MTISFTRQLLGQRCHRLPCSSKLTEWVLAAWKRTQWTEQSTFIKCIISALFIFLKIFYLFTHERHRERGRHRRQRAKQALCGEPDAGLNPRTLGSLPELKADAQPLSHPEAPITSAPDDTEGDTI